MRDLTSEIERVLASTTCDCHPSAPRAQEVLVTEGDAAEVLHELLMERGLGKGVVLVYDEVTYRILASSIESLLRSRGFVVLGHRVTGADEQNVDAVEALMRKASVGVAVGGGTVIDVCKLAAHRSGRPFVSVPTALSHDGIASPVASVSFRERRHRASVPATGPISVVAELNVLRSSPRRLKVAGAGDLLAKVTALKDWELGASFSGEQVCMRAYASELEAIRCAVSFIESGAEDVVTLLKGLLLSGAAMSLVGSSRPASGSEHLISHQIDALGKSRGLHGEQVALATVLMAKYHESLNGRWWRDPRFGWRSIKGLLELATAPTSFRDLGLTREELVDAIVRAPEIRPERVTVLHVWRAGREEAERLLDDTGLW